MVTLMSTYIMTNIVLLSRGEYFVNRFDVFRIIFATRVLIYTYILARMCKLEGEVACLDPLNLLMRQP